MPLINTQTTGYEPLEKFPSGHLPAMGERGKSPLAIGHWLLATGYWPLAIGHWPLA